MTNWKRTCTPFGVRRVRAAAVAVAGLFILGSPSAYADTGQVTVYNGCMETLAGFDLNCTANDVNLSEVGPNDVNILDKCEFPGDTVTFTAKFTTVLTAKERHDIGIYFDVGGDPEGDGAYTGSCSISSLHYEPDPPWLDLDGTTNPFDGEHKASGVQDTCGDIDAAHNPLYPVITITAVCRDADKDGYLDLPYCTSWRQPGSNELCTGPLAKDEGSGRWSTGVTPGAPSKCKCDIGFNVPVPVPAALLDVTKSADPTSVDEPGAGVLFTVTVKNSGVDPNNAVTLTALTDDIYGDITYAHDLISSTNCALGEIQPGVTYSCTFTALVQGNGGTSQTDTVLAEAVDDYGNEVAGEDDATVEILDKLPSITLVKTADPTEVLEPGGNVTFKVVIENKSVSSDPLTITSLSDDIYGALTGDADCQVGTILASGASCDFTFTEYVSGNPGTSQTDVATVWAKDDESNPVKASDDATVAINDVPSSIELTKTANPTSLDEPGGQVTFTFVVKNLSTVDTVYINSLTDSIHGDLNGQGTCSVPQTLLPGASYTCSAKFDVLGNAGDSETNKATASGKDDDGNDVNDDDSATVNILDVPPSATLTKAAAAACVEYTVVVKNTSTAEALELKALVDDIYGDITAVAGDIIETECSVPQTIGAGLSYSCYFVGCTETSPTTDKVTGTVYDDEGSYVTPSDTATVSFE